MVPREERLSQEAVVKTPADWDVIVVGGGPAGAAFARTFRALRPRARVLLVDRARFPRDKVCGDALTYQSVSLVREIFPELSHLVPSASATSRQVLWYPNGREVTRGGQQLDVIPRFLFDHALWRAALDAGAQAMEGARAVRVLREGKRVAGVEIEDDKGARLQLTADLVVRADGSASVVRRETGSLAADRIIFAVRQYVRGIPEATKGLIFFLDIEREGLFWIFPFVRDGERWANVGYGNARIGTKLRQILQGYHDRPLVRRYLGDAEAVSGPKGFPLNLAHAGFPRRFRPARPIAGNGYALVGDAAALIHPFSGEGIAFGLQSGRLAAEAFADASLGLEDKARAYQQRLIRFAAPLYCGLGAYLAIRLPVLLPPRLSDLYTRAGSLVGRHWRRADG